MTRSEMLDVLDMEYVKMARIIGVSEVDILYAYVDPHIRCG